jgi:hypothetical protein
MPLHLHLPLHLPSLELLLLVAYKWRQLPECQGVGGVGRKVGRCRHVSQRVRKISSVLKNSQEMPRKFRNICWDELNPERLTHGFVWVDQTMHLIQPRTEVAFRCQSFAIEIRIVHL